MERFVFPRGKGIIEELIGCQPVGIAIKGSTVVIADYFGPAFVIGNISVEGGTTRLHNVKRVAGTLPRRDNARMFPNVLASMAVNRMQTVIIYDETHLGLTRNSGREIFNIKLRGDGTWEHVSDINSCSGVVGVITSAVLARDGLVTIEDDRDGNYVCRDYRGFELKEHKVPANRYGIAVRESDNAIFTIADSRGDERGLFVNDKVQVPDIVGNGVALINDGQDGALVTRYSYETNTPFGRPGALLYIPPELLI